MSVDEACRLCLSEEGQMEHIFNSADVNLPQKIWQCTSVKVRDIPELPCSICEVCKSELIIWMKFRRICLKSNEILKAKYPKCFEISQLDQEDESAEVIVTKSNKSTKGGIEETEEELNDTKYCFMPDKNESIEYICEEEEEENGIEDNPNLEIGGRIIEIQVEADFESEENVEFDPKESSNLVEPARNSQSEEVIKAVSPNNRPRYIVKCNICGEERQNIKQHMRVHFDEKPFKCMYCEKAFRQRGNYTRHLNIHTGRKPYKCDECDAAFADPASLRAHKVRHTGSRAYPCDVCGKSFSHSHVLAAHKRIHTQDRRHACSFCEKRFLSSHSLKKHVRTHTGERPFKCSLCPKAFATSGNLRMHQLVHSKVKSFKCNICNDVFAYRCVLKAHMKKHMKDGSSLPEEDTEPKEHHSPIKDQQGAEEIELMQEASHSNSDDGYDEIYEIYTE